jgi:hypothetical protein
MKLVNLYRVAYYVKRRSDNCVGTTQQEITLGLNNIDEVPKYLNLWLNLVQNNQYQLIEITKIERFLQAYIKD